METILQLTITNMNELLLFLQMCLLIAIGALVGTTAGYIITYLI